MCPSDEVGVGPRLFAHFCLHGGIIHCSFLFCIHSIYLPCCKVQSMFCRTPILPGSLKLPHQGLKILGSDDKGDCTEPSGYDPNHRRPLKHGRALVARWSELLQRSLQSQSRDRFGGPASRGGMRVKLAAVVNVWNTSKNSISRPGPSAADPQTEPFPSPPLRSFHPVHPRAQHDLVYREGQAEPMGRMSIPGAGITERGNQRGVAFSTRH